MEPDEEELLKKQVGEFATYRDETERALREPETAEELQRAWKHYIGRRLDKAADCVRESQWSEAQHHAERALAYFTVAKQAGFKFVWAGEVIPRGYLPEEK